VSAVITVLPPASTLILSPIRRPRLRRRRFPHARGVLRARAGARLRL